MNELLVAPIVLVVSLVVMPRSTAAGGPATSGPAAARIGQIAAAVRAGTYSPTPTIEDRAFWQKVGRSAAGRSVVDEAAAEASRRFEPLPDELYLDYSKTGNRTRYEKVYFAKLRSFRTLVVAECVDNKGRFLKAIEQAVASYAADKTWVLPAHDTGLDNFEGRQITIDLFASEVACELANASHILGERLDEETRALVHKEARRRIFDPYTQMVTEGKPRMWWLMGTNNWNAVCLANVTGTALALLEKPQEKAFYIAAAEKYITSFLKGFTADGYCSEGIDYWNYGFGCFVRLGHMLNEVSGGEVDLFALPKARVAGLFARRMEIAAGAYPAFADCTVTSTPNPLLMRYVSRRYGLPPTNSQRSRSCRFRWLDEFGVFSFALEDEAAVAAPAKPARRDWFKDAGVLICRGATAGRGVPVGVALKGGHNAEHHNHNDVGSYVFCIGGELPLVDPGAEVYTRRTFGRDRYASGVLNSFGHAVPRVAGQLQQTGRAAAAKVLALELTDAADSMTLDLSAAYRVKSLKRLQRSFVFRRDPASLTVTDEVEFDSAESFGTAVITFGSWEKVAESRLRVHDGQRAVVVDINASGLPLAISAVKIDEDVRGGRQPTRIGIDVARPVQNATIRLTIRPATDAASSSE